MEGSLRRAAGVVRGLSRAGSREGAGQPRSGDARIVGDGDRQFVVLSFTHADFAGARFGYRSEFPGEDPCETMWLAEEIATGAAQVQLANQGGAWRFLTTSTPVPISGS